MSFAQTLVGHTSLRNGLLWLVETRHPKSRIYDSLQNHAYGIESAGGGVATNNTYTTSFPRGPASRFGAAGDGSYTIEGRKPTIETATIAMWIKCANATPSDMNKSGFPIHYTYQGGNIAAHYPYTDGVIYCNTLRSNRRSFTPSSSVNRADWHLVTVTTSPSGWRFYQNGYLVDSTTSTAVGTLQTAYFAKSIDTFQSKSFYFNGDIAWWGFWTTSFTLANVLELLRLSRGNQVAFQFPYYLVGEAVLDASTFTGTAAVTVGAATCSGAATSADPIYSGNAAVTCGATTASGTATSTAPIYSGNAAVTVGAATCSGAATSTDPVYSGNAAVAIGATTASGTAQFASAIYSGNAAVTCGAATASGTATHTAPTFTGLAAVVTAAVTASGSAAHTAPIYSGNAAVVTGPATATGTATFTSTTRTGTAAVTTGSATASGTATFVAPAYDTGTGYVNFADQYFFGGIL